MLKKYYTCMHSAEHLNDGKPTPVIIRVEGGVRYIDECYIAGEAATRLYEYERLGYSPSELKNMIQKFETQKKVLNSLYGKPEYLKANLGKIASAIADSVMNNDRQVTIMFDDSGKPVISICPYSEEVEK